MNHKEALAILDLIKHAMDTGHYARAEKQINRLLQEALETKDYEMAHQVSIAFIKCRQLHILDVLRILKRIDPIQAQRKVLS